jgi:hypothetical protein
MAIQVGTAPFPPISGAFGDRRLFLCRPGDPMLIGWWSDDQCGHEQAEDGPICLVVGPRSSRADLDRLHSRFGVPMESLIEFRSRAQGSRAALKAKHGAAVVYAD